MKIRSFFIRKYGLAFYQATFDLGETLKFYIDLEDKDVDFDSKNIFTIVDTGAFSAKNENMDSALECTVSNSRIADGVVLKGRYSITAKEQDSVYTCLSVLTDKELATPGLRRITKFNKTLDHHYVQAGDAVVCTGVTSVIVLSGKVSLDGKEYTSGACFDLPSNASITCISSGHVCFVK